MDHHARVGDVGRHTEEGQPQVLDLSLLEYLLERIVQQPTCIDGIDNLSAMMTMRYMPSSIRAIRAIRARRDRPIRKQSERECVEATFEPGDGREG